MEGSGGSAEVEEEVSGTAAGGDEDECSSATNNHEEQAVAALPTTPPTTIFQCGEDASNSNDNNENEDDGVNSKRLGVPPANGAAAAELIPLTNAILDEGEDNSFIEVPPERSVGLPGENDSVSLSQSESDSATKLKPKTTSRAALAADVTHIPIQPSDIVEYEWPQKSGDRFFIQEQISELLGINSFKRKYLDMIRRTIEPPERDYLLKELKLNVALPSHHLTALQAIDVHELMSSEYPMVYSEYQKACNARIKQAMLEKQKELEAIKLDAKKLAELREKAIKNAREFNSELQFLRTTERQQFWDTNTNVVHSPINKWMRLSSEHTRPSKYPVFLMPGQYTTYYKKFDSSQLCSFPFGSVVENKELLLPRREPSPPAICISEKEIEAAKKSNDQKQQEDSTNTKRVVKQELATPRSPQKEKEIGPPPTKLRKMSATNSSTRSTISWATSTPKIPFSSTKLTAQMPKVQPKCSVCQLADPSPTHKALLVQCSACRQQMHSSCIDMPLNMVEVIRRYEWLCIDCKRCSVCQQPDQEAAMMCCDACDRGYHTFCIGLEIPPNGTWHCPECKVVNESLKRYINVERRPMLEEKRQKLKNRKAIFKEEEERLVEGEDKSQFVPQKKKRGRPRKERPTN